jgi:hypothetical protein
MHLTPCLVKVVHQTEVKFISSGGVVIAAGIIRIHLEVGAWNTDKEGDFSRKVTFPLIPTVAMRGVTTLQKTC